MPSTSIVPSASTKPCILYNVPSRTGCNLLPQSVAVLAKHPNIVAIKEASGNFSQIAELISLTKGEIDVYSGNDDQIVPLLSLGGKGVISVLSNVAPRVTHDIVKLALDGDIKASRDLQLEYLDLCNALFCDVNPIPVKEALCLMGKDVGRCRMPLSPLNEKNEALLRAVLKKHNMI